MGRHMSLCVARVMLLGCALSRGAAAGPSLDSDQGGSLLHSNQHYEVPSGPDAMGLPVAAAGAASGTCDLLVRGSGLQRIAPVEAMPEPAGFRFEAAVMVSAPASAPGLPRGAVPAPPSVAALAVAIVIGGRRRRRR